MEVRNIRAFFAKRDQSATRTFIINMTIGVCLFLVFGALTTIVSAQEPISESTETEGSADTTENERETNAAERAEVREETQAERAETRQEMQAERVELRTEAQAERRALLSERASNRILALANNVSEKMRAAIARMEQIIGRFETRLDILAQNGVDTTAAAAKLLEARQHLTDASDIIETEVDALVDNVVTSEAPRVNWVAAKTAYQTARASLQAARTSIQEALALAKDAAANPPAGAPTPDQTTDTETIDPEPEVADTETTN